MYVLHGMSRYYLQLQIVARLGGYDEHRVSRHSHDALDLSFVLSENVCVELVCLVGSDQQVLGSLCRAPLRRALHPGLRRRGR